MNDLGTNVAVTFLLPLTVTTQVVAVPEQSPDQPLNLHRDDFGFAVRVTDELLLNGAVHVAPQLIPAGADVTEPPRLDVAVTDRL